MKKHVSLDLWGTLIKSNPVYREMRNKLFEYCFNVKCTPESLSKNKQMVDYLNEITGGQISYSQTILMMLSEKVTNIDKKAFLDQVDTFNQMNHQIILDNYPLLIDDSIPNLLAVIRRRGITLSVLSNTSIIRGASLKLVLKKLGIHDIFKYQIYSDEVKMSKPNPAIYREMIKQALRSPEDIIHIGDNAFSDSGVGLVDSILVTKENTITKILKSFHKNEEIIIHS